MKETELNIEKEFWCIVRSGDPKGYDSGKAYIKVALYQFDTATEMSDSLGEGSVHAGESMGDFIFQQLAISHKWEILNQIIEHEKEQEELEKAEQMYEEGDF